MIIAVINKSRYKLEENQSNNTPYIACPKGCEHIVTVVTYDITFPIREEGVFCCIDDITKMVNIHTTNWMIEKVIVIVIYDTILGTSNKNAIPIGIINNPIIEIRI